MAIVRQLAPRLGYSAGEVDTLVAMVEHHLLLPDVALRRDLTDTATIEKVAEAVETVERLELLHALTEADSLATGPAAWGSWQAELVNELVARVRHVLGGGDATEVTWRLFPDAETLARMAAETVDVRRDGDVITVVTPDRAGSFSRVAGVLSMHGLDVLSAQALSDEHGMAASQFRVMSDDADMKWGAVKADLGRALANELAIEARIAERATTYRRRRQTQAGQPAAPKVVFDDAASSNATVIEVRATDQGRDPASHHQGAQRARPRHPARDRAVDRHGGRRHVLRPLRIGRPRDRSAPPPRDRSRPSCTPCRDVRWSATVHASP